ncbi:restriction endonuclease [Rhodococcus sp. D2-41]|uniref:Type I restriction enzyme HsdR N-terminal domain-containing protein n=1 Tax=Speluncibacter jeojiensis TaxID=2710754 RepID=A0A9X4RFD5_9ACTN|nr:type I restriction endonuclease [Rhodococcus sp. D2-41]MDG3008901.1 restriction endonuclease [Rhodococcus sp. D2-41]MDG3016523.1 type I restriction enzyme HsdR N-terminal domain-containing protein [Corynebacteriales bacterium D3-21]
MSFADGLNALAAKIRDKKGGIETEEATKNAFIMPFISSVLGYDVFDPSEVVPELVADVGVKKGEKIDYAIMQNGAVQILIECKKIGEPLNLAHAAQLFRYFAVTSARIAILTNGQVYQVYTDGDAPNRMDEKPFLVFDLLDLDRTVVPEIQKLSKESFDLDSVVSAAEELKYIGLIKRILANEIKEPSDDWIRYFVARAYDGKATQKVVDQFRGLVDKATAQYIADQVNDRLKSALGDEAGHVESAVRATPAEPVDVEVQRKPVATPDPDIVTTEEELDGFNIVRAIAVSEVAAERIVYRDAKSYFAVLLDDNNRKPVIRLHLNGKSVRFVTTFEDANKTGVRHDIETVVDIYKVADQIRATIRSYNIDSAAPIAVS